MKKSSRTQARKKIIPKATFTTIHGRDIRGTYDNFYSDLGLSCNRAMASVLTPYRPSDGNNPYTEAQLKSLWKDLEPTSREPGKYAPEERLLLQREVLKYIAEGFTATRAVAKIQMLAEKQPDVWPYADYAVFMAWKTYDKDFADAWEVAYAMGTDNLEDKGVELAFAGNASMLQFLLKVRRPERYNPKQEVSGNLNVAHVHKIELVAAKAIAAPLGEAPENKVIDHIAIEEIEDAEVLDDE